MAEKEEQKLNLPQPTAPAAAAPSAAPAIDQVETETFDNPFKNLTEDLTPSGPGKKFKSTGWKIHNELTYRGIDWLLNSTVGVTWTYLTNKTELGRKLWAEPWTKFFKAALKPIVKSEHSRAEGAKWGQMIMSIIVGGTIIIPPMMMMESKKNKKRMVRWLDEKVYGKEEVENNPQFAELYKRIDEEPRKGFWTGMGARWAVLVPMIAWTSIEASNKYFVRYMYQPIGKATKHLAESMGIKPQKLLEAGEMVYPQGNVNLPKAFQSNWDFLHQTIGFDFGLTFIYAFMHEFAYKGLAAMLKKKHSPLPAAGEAPALPATEISTGIDINRSASDELHTHRASIISRGQFTDLARKIDEPDLQVAL